MSSQHRRDSLVWVVVALVAVAVLSPLLMVLFAMPMMGMMGWWWGGGGPGTGLSPLWGVGMTILPLLALVGVGYLFYRGLVESGGSEDDPALRELRTAYARGDLSDEEFDRRRQRLRRESE